MIMPVPLLYRGSPNIREPDVASALNGLKHDIWSMTEVSEDVMKLFFHYVDTWFPAFKKEEKEE